MHRLTAAHLLPIELDTAWAFFSDPRNLASITPPWLNLVPTSRVPDTMYPGLIVTYDIRPALGISVPWVSEITHVVDGRLFVDEQRVGPYRFWHHQHHFREAPGGTEIRDIVHYALPLGFVGEVVAGPAVRDRLRRIFDYRRDALARRFSPRVPT